MFIRQNDTGKIGIGPAVSVSDGFTAVTTLNISTTDSARARLGDDTTVDISGYTFAATANMDGAYDLTLQTGITDTIGSLDILIEDVSLCLPIYQRFYVLEEAVYDALYATNATMLTAKDVGLLFEDPIATVNSQTSFDMTGTITTDDNWIGNLCTIEDVTNGETVSARITDVDQANDRIIISAAPVFTVAAADKIRVFREYHPTAALNDYDPPTRTEATTDKNSILAKLLAYVQLLTRSDAAIAADNSAEVTEINTDGGSGAGSYDNETDSLEEIEAGVNVEAVNKTTVQGTGISTDKWRG